MASSGGRGLLVGMLLRLQVSKAQVAPELSSAQLDFARSPGCAIYGLTGCTRFRTHQNNIALTSFDPHCRVRTYEDTTNFPVDADFNMGRDFQRGGGEVGCCALPVYGKDSTIRRNKASLLMASGRTIASYVPIWKVRATEMCAHMLSMSSMRRHLRMHARGMAHTCYR